MGTPQRPWIRHEYYPADPQTRPKHHNELRLQYPESAFLVGLFQLQTSPPRARLHKITTFQCMYYVRVQLNKAL